MKHTSRHFVCPDDRLPRLPQYFLWISLFTYTAHSNQLKHRIYGRNKPCLTPLPYCPWGEPVPTTLQPVTTETISSLLFSAGLRVWTFWFTSFKHSFLRLSTIVVDLLLIGSENGRYSLAEMFCYSSRYWNMGAHSVAYKVVHEMKICGSFLALSNSVSSLLFVKNFIFVNWSFTNSTFSMTWNIAVKEFI